MRDFLRNEIRYRPKSFEQLNKIINDLKDEMTNVFVQKHITPFKEFEKILQQFEEITEINKDLKLDDKLITLKEYLLYLT